MQWNNHSKDVPEGAHAFLSPSKYSWTNYSDEKLETVYRTHLATLQGTVLHAFACECIRLHQNLPKSRKTLNMYVNDAIGYGMTPEQPLYFSPNCFGTADAISFKRNFLRIHDLKTGETKASLRQLEVYAALFCLEYDVKPETLDGMELRIYQSNDIIFGCPEADVIKSIMGTIVHFDKIIEKCREGEDYV